MLGGLAAVAVLAACSANAGAGLPASASVSVEARGSWMAPEAKSDDLLYVSDRGTKDVYVYSYPQRVLVGTLTGFDWPSGECTDRAGDVFIANWSAANVLEYAHAGTTPIATLSDPNQTADSCSIDPTTGDLAVANIYNSNGSGLGSISIYKQAQGMPRTYSDFYMYFMWFCGYDDKGNLFVDGFNNGGTFQFAELPKGRNKFKNITLDYPIYTPGGIAWDGKYVTVEDQGFGDGSEIYQTTGASGKVVNATPLSGSCDVVQFTIVGGKVIGPDYCNNDVGFWKYPVGGPVKKTIGGLSTPFGSALSRAAPSLRHS
jgi:hypothetical protein